MNPSRHLLWALTVILLSLGCTKTNEVAEPAVAASAQSNFQEQFEYLLPLLDEHHDLQVRVVQNTSGNAQYVFYFVPKSGDDPGSRAIVCQGSGVGFARCCDAWLSAHPGKCLKVTKHENGEYTADDDC